MVSGRQSEERFQRLYQANVRQVYGYFLRRTDAEAAQDLTADTFLVAWRRLTVVPDGDRTLPWLYGVARRVLANHQRSAARARRLFSKVGWLRSETPPTPEVLVVRRREDLDVIDALGRLRPDDQELLRLTVWEELPYDQVGGLLGCSAHAVAQRRYRAVSHLARELDTTGHKQVTSATQHTAKGEAK
ncbi:MAG: sigma-70 family RNA polymerase sigma factor [Acidimicrobiia bacterium]|nr:sigma-70 family RNA polymerase sigma factor [Acidimicrobiia bacterium]